MKLSGLQGVGSEESRFDRLLAFPDGSGNKIALTAEQILEQQGRLYEEILTAEDCQLISARREFSAAVLALIRLLTSNFRGLGITEIGRAAYELLERYHGLGYRVPFGAGLRYLVRSQRAPEKVRACLLWFSPAWRMAARDA